MPDNLPPATDPIVRPPARWRCKRLDSDPENGFNDAGTETFKKDQIHSLVRETLQNSLDAKPDPKHLSDAEKELPVEVEYSLFEIDSNSFPDANAYRAILKACLDAAGADAPEARKFFARAVTVMKRPKLKILRISDRNTRGLQGAETDDRAGTWHRLVKMRGGANLSARAGGSFGIGKGATFLVSPLRTVFYSSVARNDVPDSPPGFASHVGCAHLTTYRDANGDETTGFVFYTDNERNMAVPGAYTFGEPVYVRDVCGTDLYIAGFDPKDHEYTPDSFVDRVRAEVLDNFLLTLKLGKLSFRLLVDGVEKLSISRDNLADEIGKLPDRQPGKRYEPAISATLDRAQTVRKFWEMIQGEGETSEAISDEKTGNTVFPAGAFTYWMRKDESSSTTFRTSRSVGMTIGNLKNLSGSIGCLGFLTITDPDMDAEFRAMENPLHTEWDPANRNTTDDRKESRRLLDLLKKYLRNLIQQRLGPKIGDTIDELEGFGPSADSPDQTTAGGSGMELTGVGENRILETRSLLSGGIRTGGGLGNNPWSPGGGKKGTVKKDGTRKNGPAAGGGDEEDGFRPEDFAEQPRVFALGGQSAAKYRCSVKLPATLKKQGTIRLYFNSEGETTTSFELPVANCSVVHSPGNRVSVMSMSGKNWVEFGQVGPGDEITFDVCFSGISHYVYVNMALRTKAIARSKGV